MSLSDNEDVLKALYHIEDSVLRAEVIRQLASFDLTQEVLMEAIQHLRVLLVTGKEFQASLTGRGNKNELHIIVDSFCKAQNEAIQWARSIEDLNRD